MHPSSLINFHTHTSRCHHAEGGAEDYCAAAEQAGLRILGFSDHNPVPADNHPWRMPFGDLEDYRNEVRAAAAAHPGLTVKLGLEAEPFPDFPIKDIRSVYHGFDYLIGSLHEAGLGGNMKERFSQGREEGIRLVNSYSQIQTELIESGLFVCIAHPDMFGTFSDVWLPEYDAPVRDLIRCAIRHDIFLEVNAYGLRKPVKQTSAGPRHLYPQFRFWEIAAEEGFRKAVIGMDAHRPEDVASNRKQAEAFLAQFGLTTANAEMAERILSGKTAV